MIVLKKDTYPNSRFHYRQSVILKEVNDIDDPNPEGFIRTIIDRLLKERCEIEAPFVIVHPMGNHLRHSGCFDAPIR